MSSPYDNRGSSRRRHGLWSHWVPLVVTVTVATVGVAAWVWSQRTAEEIDDKDDDARHLDYDNPDHGDNPAYAPSHDAPGVRGGPPSFKSDPRPDEVGYGTTHDADPAGSTWGARMSGALRRTPSPQHIFDRAGKTVAAGVAAAGTAVGSALAAIREEDKAAYADHETWSEEADAKKDKAPGSSNRKRKTVAIVVSADTHVDDVDDLGDDGYHEHAVWSPAKMLPLLHLATRTNLGTQSILSHIPKQNDHFKIKLFVLMYAPSLKDTVTETGTTRPPASLSSSFSLVGHEQALTPGDEARSPL